MHESTKILKDLVSTMISEDESTQDDAYSLIMSVLVKIVEAATIKNNSGHYRFSSSMEVSKENLVKRSINNLGIMSNNWSPYRFALHDSSKENLDKQSKLLFNQIRFICQSYASPEELDEISSSLTETILNNWNLNLRA
jgi:hypothetical protein